MERENARLRGKLRRREEEFQINLGQQQMVQQVVPLAQLLQFVEPRYEAVYERFRKQQPPNFDGRSDPIEAEEWLRSVESILKHMRLENEDRISLLNKKYYYPAILATRVDEFIALTQGNSTVTEYAGKFDRLAKFVANMVPTETLRIQRFRKGLKSMIARDVKLIRGITTYAETLEVALEAEQAEERIWKEGAARRDAKKNNDYQNDHKRKHDDGQNQKVDKTNKSASENNGNKKPYVEYPQCPICRRKHLGECRYRTKGCFNYGDEGHIKKDFPKLKDRRKDDKLRSARVLLLLEVK
ncbi:uncharacterized protein LOC133807366 [Humulus lupulus]|uniref:uncharacterized protein LOC133807366 n=1 Tax=Humulus lupulus TaxID=3486 RepID=UPI002B40A131|nr:uncharacterized protein LOC133807366 [Humulus lupulus]